MSEQHEPIYASEEFRDSIATVDKSGKRIWIYPKKPSGRFTNIRTYVSWVLLAVLIVTPFIKINGTPLFLFNILERKFILFGVTFLPQDFHIFVIAMLTLLVFIILFTVVYGRLFCGWVCPQTIFMEMVYRKIEYWLEGDAPAQRRLNNAPWDGRKIRIKTIKQLIFFAIAIFVSNLFLAYIIGVEEVIRIATEPVNQHLGGFAAMVIFSFAFYYVFAFLREQVCVTICPYGRLQGVMLDKNSIVVAYDWIRGEPRGKIKRSEKKTPKTSADLLSNMANTATTHEVVDAPKAELGDCIDCKMCIYVCPTGIDIRNGTQLECINCTACIDACDEIMDKVNRPRGLIRYDSIEGIATGRQKIMTPRAYAYSAVLLVLIAANAVFLGMRSSVELLLLRTPGMLYQETEDGYISNLYNYQLVNKTDDSATVELKLINVEGRIRYVGEAPRLKPGEITKGAVFIDLHPSTIKDRSTKLSIDLVKDDEIIDQTRTNFLGPK